MLTVYWCKKARVYVAKTGSGSITDGTISQGETPSEAVAALEESRAMMRQWREHQAAQAAVGAGGSLHERADMQRGTGKYTRLFW